jgi:hypothetical protein
VRASRNPYDGMTDDTVREELARQTRLLGAVASGAIDPVEGDGAAPTELGRSPVPPSRQEDVDEPFALHEQRHRQRFVR